MMKKTLFLAALLLLLTTASGCRSRTSAAPRASGAQPPAASSDSGAAADGEPEALTENGGETVENPLAERAEYDEAARAELLENQSRAVSGGGEGGGLPLTQKDADSRDLQLDSAAELAAVKTLPAEEAERLGVSESAPVAETAQRYYAALLQSRLRTLFECKKQNVYIETQAAFITVYKSSAEHALVLSAGGYDVAGKRMGYDVAAKRAENDLTVDGGWVQRKNPDFIVKFVAASALNGDTLGELLARDGLRETAAAKNGRALLLCESMTDAPQLQTAAALCLAKAMYPDLFADIDAAQAVGQLADEAGAQTGGPWFYPAI